MDELERKTTSIIDNLDAAIETFEQALLISDPKKRKAHLRSAVFHWFAILFDEGRAHRFDLMTSVSTLTEQVSRLKKKNAELLRLLSQARKV